MMKFTVVAVLFALALGVHSSIVPVPQLILSNVLGQPISIVGGSPSLALVKPVPPPAAVAIHESPVQIVSHPTSVVLAGHPSPIVVAAPAVPAPVVVSAPVPEGTYVAKTLGALHIAPLPGHANSASSVNLEPAPGTL